ncbi:MAG: MarR family transcriptional regulator, partial [Dehalococcoidia bacterium]|nr:MarR family transcriptional regulator [Dehalococcoidia bacterium]
LRSFAKVVNMFDPIRVRIWAELGLTTAQLRVMFHMRETPGVTAGELAQRMAVTPPTISGIVDRLVRLDLVRREDDESDRRLVRNHLTEKGESACGWLERGLAVYIRRILTDMGEDELDAFISGMKAFSSASERLAQTEPNLVAVAMAGVNAE